MSRPTTSSSSSSVIQQRSKSNNKRPVFTTLPLSRDSSFSLKDASDNNNNNNNSSNSKRFRNNDHYHNIILFLNNYYHLKSPLGRLRFLFVATISFSILSILLFHPPCYRRRAKGMLLCKISREMGIIAELPPKPKEILPPQERTRLLLGFMSKGDDLEEKRRRDNIRNVFRNHIAFDQDHATAAKHVCSVQEYLSNPVEFKFCKVAYTFLVGGNSEGTHLDFNRTYPSSLSYEKTTLYTTTNQEQTEQFDEPDVVFLNVQDTNNVRKVFAWYEHSTKIRMERSRKFDYVAFTDTFHTIDIDTFLGNDIFQVRSSIPLTYAGLHVNESRCSGYNRTHACSRLMTTDGKFMSDFVALSRDMVEYSLSHSNLIQLDGLYPQDRPDIAIANLFRFHPTKSLNITHLDGITVLSNSVI